MSDRKPKVKKGINLEVATDQVLLEVNSEPSNIILLDSAKDVREKARIVVGYGPETKGVEIGDVVSIIPGFIGTENGVTDYATKEVYIHISYRAIGVIHTGDSKAKLLSKCTESLKEGVDRRIKEENLRNSNIVVPDMKVMKKNNK